MRPLLTLSARWASFATLAVLFLGVFSGTVRILPWLAAPGVPIGMCLPFAKLLFSAALEAAALIGPLVGVAIATALFVERGEAAALHAVGASPARLVRPLLVSAVFLGFAYAGVSSLRDPEPPGRFARRLVEFGRSSCSLAQPRVDVPLVSMSWLCLRSLPRIAGRVPGVGQNLWFSALTFEPDERLVSASLEDVHVAGHLRDSEASLSFHFGRVHIAGLPGWGRRGAMSGPLRGAIVASGGFGAAAFIAWLILRARCSRPIAATVVAGLSAIAMLTALHALDESSAPRALYGLVPMVGALVALLGILGVVRLFGGRVAGYVPR